MIFSGSKLGFAATGSALALTMALLLGGLGISSAEAASRAKSSEAKEAYVDVNNDGIFNAGDIKFSDAMAQMKAKYGHDTYLDTSLLTGVSERARPGFVVPAGVKLSVEDMTLVTAGNIRIRGKLYATLGSIKLTSSIGNITVASGAMLGFYNEVQLSAKYDATFGHGSRLVSTSDFGTGAIQVVASRGDVVLSESTKFGRKTLGASTVLISEFSDVKIGKNATLFGETIGINARGGKVDAKGARLNGAYTTLTAAAGDVDVKKATFNTFGDLGSRVTLSATDGKVREAGAKLVNVRTFTISEDGLTR